MKTLLREVLSSVFPVRGLIVLVGLLVSATCSKAGTYTYVDVYVSIDRQTVPVGQLFQVISCEFQVLGADVSDAINLRCPEKQVPYDVGTFQWTSGAASGSLQFRVRTFDGNHLVLGEGTSETVPVSPGKHLETSVLIVAALTTTGPDAGDDAQSPIDAGIETVPTD
jgi:hypothetical protein